MGTTEKTLAISTLLREGRTERLSTTGAKRCVKACKALGLTAEEIRHVMFLLDFADADGEPYTRFVKRVWP